MQGTRAWPGQGSWGGARDRVPGTPPASAPASRELSTLYSSTQSCRRTSELYTLYMNACDSRSRCPPFHPDRSPQG